MHVMERDLINDRGKIGFFYGGSIAENREDWYSDIDLRIVVKDTLFETYRSNKKERGKSWGDVLFYEDIPWATHSVIHYKSFIKADVFYYTIHDLKPSIYLIDIKIVYDPKHVLCELKQLSHGIRYVLTIEEFEVWRGKVFAYIHEVYRRIMRNEYKYVFTMINGLSMLVANGWYMEKGIQPNTLGNWSKIEGQQSVLSEEQLSKLMCWDTCKRDDETIMKTMNSVIFEFKYVHTKLCAELGVTEDSQWIEEIFSYVK
ncbi:hypothetical protein [Bacillus suaedaesalsae]|uniref:Nucleotidyltransferase domain-containing protein n=1 Tax=Bacillus suaedaesalsae TaxID=2810349 RepID=A0ABS2DK01_9BACI|nr:hypothetical protein [Bacillus suaedaesalsae]MBM6618814.1 hypothetical protein [Bacillus suaedaesalsae]